MCYLNYHSKANIPSITHVSCKWCIVYRVNFTKNLNHIILTYSYQSSSTAASVAIVLQYTYIQNVMQGLGERCLATQIAIWQRQVEIWGDSSTLLPKDCSKYEVRVRACLRVSKRRGQKQFWVVAKSIRCQRKYFLTTPHFWVLAKNILGSRRRSSNFRRHGTGFE